MAGPGAGGRFFGGGGWGLVTSTLISKDAARGLCGSVSNRIFVTLASALTFAMIGVSHWQVFLDIIGGLIGAPIAARLVGKLPMKTMFIAVDNGGNWVKILLKAVGVF